MEGSGTFPGWEGQGGQQVEGRVNVGEERGRSCEDTCTVPCRTSLLEEILEIISNPHIVQMEK